MPNTNDTIQIGPYTYNILKVVGRRILIQWTESTGIQREMWFIMKTELKKAVSNG